MALFVHHRDMFPRDLERRLLPVCVKQKDDVVKIKRNVFKVKAAERIFYMPDLSHLPPPQPRHVSRRSAIGIMREVLEERCINYLAFISSARGSILAQARQEVCWRVANETDLSLKDIGRLVHKDHSTVMNAIMRWCDDHGLPLPKGKVWKRRYLANETRDRREPIQRQHLPEMAE